MAAINLAYTKTHDETKPAGTRAVSLGDDDIRELKFAVRERLAQDHQMLADETGITDIGIHKKVTFKIHTGNPTAYDDVAYLYIKTVGSREELFYMDDAGNVLQLTSVGKILGDSVELSNNTNLKAKNAAGTGTVNLIKANASDKPEVPDGSVMATSAAPTVGAGIANKKYVDDNKKVFQVVNTQSGAVSTGIAYIPYDDTIPQITEGFATPLTRAITPTSATNKLRIDAVLVYSPSNDGNGTTALFKAGTNDALAAVNNLDNAGNMTTIAFTHYMTAGVVSEITFSVRNGQDTDGRITTINGVNQARKMGGVMASSITITEIAA